MLLEIIAIVVIASALGHASETDSEGLFALRCQSPTLISNKTPEMEPNWKFGFHPSYLAQDLGPDVGIFSTLIMPWFLAILRLISCLGSLLTVVILQWARLTTTPRLIAQKHRALSFFLFSIFFYVDCHVIEVPCFLCVLSGMLANFFVLSSFTWNVIEGWLLFNAIVRKQPMDKQDSHTYLLHLALGYLLPFLATLTLIAAVHFGLISVEGINYHTMEVVLANCWIKSEVYMWGFILPLLLTMSINISVLVAVLYTMNQRIPVRSRTDSKKSQNSTNSNGSIGRIVRQETSDSQNGNWRIFMKHARILLILSFLLGLNGSISVLKFVYPHWSIHFVGGSFCSSSGIFFFVHSVLLNETLRKRMQSRRRTLNTISTLVGQDKHRK